MSPPIRVSSPRARLPTLADAVAASRAAQLESGLAAAVPGPLYLCAAGRAAEGGVVGLALGGDCGEKTSQGHPLSPGPRERPGSQKESSLCRRRKGGGFTKPPCTAHPGCAAHAAPPKARLRAKAGETASLCRKASHTGSANSRHRSSHLCWRVLSCCVLFLSYSVCAFGLFLNQEQK